MREMRRDSDRTSLAKANVPNIVSFLNFWTFLPTSVADHPHFYFFCQDTWLRNYFREKTNEKYLLQIEAFTLDSKDLIMFLSLPISLSLFFILSLSHHTSSSLFPAYLSTPSLNHFHKAFTKLIRPKSCMGSLSRLINMALSANPCFHKFPTATQAGLNGSIPWPTSELLSVVLDSMTSYGGSALHLCFFLSADRREEKGGGKKRTRRKGM